MAEVHAEQGDAGRPGSSAARRGVPSPPTRARSRCPRRRPATSAPPRRPGSSAASARAPGRRCRRRSAAPRPAGRFSASLRPVCATSRTARRPTHWGPPRPPAQVRLVQRRGAPAQPDEVLDVAGRPGQRACRDAPDAEPEPAAAAVPPDRAARARIRTTPPAPTRSLPTSNCGLTMSTKSASGLAHATRAGSTSAREMKDRSATTRSGGGATWSGQVRTLTRSSTVTRASVRSDQASCP